ncbi:MAG: hypothetical protein ACI4U4_05045 [Bacilli bacterium]
MSKKQYTIIGVSILIFIIIIVFILIKGQNNTWTKEILTSTSYEIYKEDCNNNQTKLDNKVINNIDTYWKDLSNNGPWLGDNNNCYEKIIIKYDRNGIIQEKELLLIDDKSVVLRVNNTDTYYVNADNLIKYLKGI